MVSAVTLYVEGGGDSKGLHSRCREGFRKLLENASFKGRMPRIVAGGGRDRAFDMFCKAQRTSGGTDCAILLVDSEEPVRVATCWEHLQGRDHWARPHGATDDQAQLMVTCMETWIMADRAALRCVFGDCLRLSALLPESGLEQRRRDEVQEVLENATRGCSRRKAYRKGARSFEVLAKLDPDQLKQHLSYFRRLVEALDNHLPSQRR